MDRISYVLGRCSLGALIVAASGKGICAIALGDDPEELIRETLVRFPSATAADASGLNALLAGVVDLVEHPWRASDLPLDIRGTAFQRKVWQALRAIPAGRTASYRDIAQRIGQQRAVRAVAGACAANALAIAIPCHRVVRSDGSLSGYRWGGLRKRALLDREAGRDRT